jgi:branched-chain amino acid transport system permease protein
MARLLLDLYTPAIHSYLGVHQLVSRLIARLLTAVFLVVGFALLPAAGAGASTPAGESSVQVRIQDQDAAGTKTPVPEVTITVTTLDGVEVGSAITDAKGVALIEGLVGTEFKIIVDEATLPEGTSLLPDPNSGEEGPERTVTVGAIGKGTKNLLTGEGKKTDLSWINRVPQRLVDGTRLGLVIAITSVGLSLIFGTTGLTNFAHGELVTFGGVIGWFINVSIGIPLLVAGPMTVLIGGAAAYLLDIGLWGQLRKRGVGLISQMVVSVGLSILLRNVYLWRFGGRTKPFADYSDQTQWTWWRIGITPRDLITSILALAVLVGVALALQKTRLGKATRAVADNVDLASATGIDSEKVIRLVWFVGGALAALGGILRGLDEQISAEMGGNLLFLMFAGITLGGLGSAYGALAGGFVVGVFTELLTLAVPTELKNVPPLLVLIGVLLVRPQGILGRKERVG